VRNLDAAGMSLTKDEVYHIGAGTRVFHVKEGKTKHTSTGAHS
jgi:hypothetical protein